jgi:hypothetical protein
LKIPKLMRGEKSQQVCLNITSPIGIRTGKKTCFLLASYVTRLLHETVQVPVWQQRNEPTMTVPSKANDLKGNR